MAALVLAVLVFPSFHPLAWAAGEPEWSVVVEVPNPSYTEEDVAGILTEAYLWLLIRGLEPAPPCGASYLVRITPDVGVLGGTTYTYYEYYADSLEIASACVEEIHLGFYEEEGNFNNRSNLGVVYDLEARMTAVHELLHAVQLGLQKYAVLDDELERSLGWVVESSATAIEYFYVGFLDSYYTTRDNTTRTIMSRLAENIIDYYSGALYNVDPFTFSLESYDYHYDRLYDFAPFFIWLFETKGFSRLADFYATRDPRYSPLVLAYLEEFLHQLPLGFEYRTSNKTMILYPRATPVEENTFRVTLAPRSAQYLEPQLPPGRYQVTLTSNENSVSYSVAHPKWGALAMGPDEFSLTNGTILTFVNMGNRTATVEVKLDYLGPLDDTMPLVVVTRTITLSETLTRTLTETMTTTITRENTVTETVTSTLTQTVTVTEEKTLAPPTVTTTLTLLKTLTRTVEKTTTFVETTYKVITPPTQTVTSSVTVTETIIVKEATLTTLPLALAALIALAAIAIMARR